MVKLSIVFPTGRGISSEELNAKSRIFLDSIQKIPTDKMEKVVQKYMANGRMFPKPTDLNQIWDQICIENSKWQKAAEQNSINQRTDLPPEDYATLDEHDACMKIIQYALNEAIDIPRGQELMKQAFAGNITG